jgi:hypothetical protein
MASDYEDLVEVLREKTRTIIDLEDQLRDKTTKVEVPEGLETVDIEVIEGSTPEETRSNLQAVIDQYTNNPDDRDTFVERGARLPDAEYAAPEIISQNEYAYGEFADEYSKITINYYPLSRTLLDDDQDVIEDVDGYVGWKNLNRFGDMSEDPLVVYIRNERLETDFEVINHEDESLPLHVQYAMPKAEFDIARRTGRLKIEEDE